MENSAGLLRVRGAPLCRVGAALATLRLPLPSGTWEVCLWSHLEPLPPATPCD